MRTVAKESYNAIELAPVSILPTCVLPRRSHRELEEALDGVVQSSRPLSGF